MNSRDEFLTTAVWAAECEHGRTPIVRSRPSPFARWRCAGSVVPLRTATLPRSTYHPGLSAPEVTRRLSARRCSTCFDSFRRLRRTRAEYRELTGTAPGQHAGRSSATPVPRGHPHARFRSAHAGL